MKQLKLWVPGDTIHCKLLLIYFENFLNFQINNCAYLIIYNKYCDILPYVEHFGMVILHQEDCFFFTAIYEFQFPKFFMHLVKDWAMLYFLTLLIVLNLEGVSRRSHLDQQNVFYVQKSLSYFLALKNCAEKNTSEL